MISTGRDIYMTIWKITENNDKINAAVTTAKKDKRTNTYVNSSWYVRFVGEALQKAKTLADKDRIKVLPGDCSLENIYNSETKKSILSITIFNFEPIKKENTSSNSDDLPF